MRKFYYLLVEICYSLGCNESTKRKQWERRVVYRQYAVSKVSSPRSSIPQLVSVCILSRSTLSIPQTYSPICWPWTFYVKLITRDLIHELISLDFHSLEAVLKAFEPYNWKIIYKWYKYISNYPKQARCPSRQQNRSILFIFLNRITLYSLEAQALESMS